LNNELARHLSRRARRNLADLDAVAAAAHLLSERPIDLLIATLGAEVVQAHLNRLTGFAMLVTDPALTAGEDRIKIDAETLLGGYLREMPPDKTAKLKRGPVVPKGNHGKSLSDLGLTKKESSEAQLLSKLKEEDPEKHEAVRWRQ
jgi:hypothetical protein